MRLGILGDAPVCDPASNPSPCTWWDGIWVRDECLAWLQQCSPKDPRVIAMQSGFLAGTAAGVGQAVGAGISPIGQAAGQVAGNTLASLFGGLFVNEDGSTNWVTVGVVGALAVGTVVVLTKR